MKLRKQRQHWPALLGLAGSLAFSAVTVAAASLDQNWPQWRGPLQNGVAPLAKAQAVVTATDKIRSYDLASGEVLWECGGLTRNVIPCPVADTGMVYCMSGFQGNALLAIRLGRTGDLTGTDAIAWTHNKSTPYVPSPLLYDGKLYFFANNNGVLTCLETKSGEPLFEAQKLEDLAGVYASPLGAAGRVYLAGRNGVTIVLKQSDKLEVLATNRLEEKFDASPAAVGKDLFLRGHEYRPPDIRLVSSKMLIPFTPVASFSRNRPELCEPPSPTKFGKPPSASSGG
jgi:outer membrane protein assembly factor BamB